MRNSSVNGCLPLKLFTVFESCSAWEVSQGTNNHSNKGNAHKTPQPVIVHKTKYYDIKKKTTFRPLQNPTGWI